MALPVRFGGLGMLKVDRLAYGAFLAAALTSINFTTSTYAPTDSMAVMHGKLCDDVDRIVEGLSRFSGVVDMPPPYAHDLGVAVHNFLVLFEEAEGRQPNLDQDGFEGTLASMAKHISVKFQRRYTHLMAAHDLKELKGHLTPEQQAILRSNASASSAPYLMGLPSGHNVVQNPEFRQLCGRRLLNTNLSQSSNNSRCPAFPANCNGQSGSMDDAHMEVCSAITGGQQTERHEAVKDVLTEVCKQVGLKVGLVDADRDPATVAKLKAAGVQPQGQRNSKFRGGDILVWGVNGPIAGSPPTVIDVTVVSERAVSARQHDHPAEVAETRKRAKHQAMYDKIGYRFEPFAIEIGGRMGKAAEAFLAMLKARWEDKMGAGTPPPQANWTCPSFTSYWRQRLITATQSYSAKMFLDRTRRMHVLGSAGRA